MAALRSYRVKCKAGDTIVVEECEGYGEIAIRTGNDGNYHRVWLDKTAYVDLLDALYLVKLVVPPEKGADAVIESRCVYCGEKGAETSCPS